MTLQELIKERILVIDGAMGTMIQRYGLTEADFRGERFASVPGIMAGNNDLLCLTRPDVIGAIHRSYLQSGADIIETNTFNSQRISLAHYHVEDCCREINLEACRIAREAADEFTAQDPSHPRFVAGSVGPTGRTCSMSPDVSDPAYRDITFDQLEEAYIEQMEALLQGGVDLLLIETIFDTLNAKAAISAARKSMEHLQRKVPVILSVTVSDKSGRMLSGQTLEAFLISVAHAAPLCVGLNCSSGARDMAQHVRTLAAQSPYYVSVYPNAGLPDSLGQYDQTPELMRAQMTPFVEQGWVNIIGGCCGTIPQHIAALAELARQGRPHVPHPVPATLELSGLEPLIQREGKGFVNVGERCNVAGSRKFLRLIGAKQYDEALQIARKQVEDGAMVIDVNMDDALLDSKAEMVRFLNLLASEPDICRVPVMIDSSKWEVIQAALRVVQGKCIVNSLSLKEGEEVFLQRAAEVHHMGAALVVMAFDERGQADTFARKIEVCGRAYRLLVDKVGFAPRDIIFDPNVLSIATGIETHNHYAVDFIEAAAWIKANLPGAHVSGGVSNLSFALRGHNYLRQAMHAVFLQQACARGMDMGIVNPASGVMVDDLPADVLEVVEDAVLDRRADAAERLIALAQRLKEADAGNTGTPADAAADSWRKASVEERLGYALLKGIDNWLEQDLDEACGSYGRAVDIIEGPLMAGMNEVGQLFGQGLLFLPQVVKSARTMKKAVAILQPRIEAQRGGDVSYAGRVLLATVKGDVHDIGKNIVSVVMACNNYEVIDLGVMTPAQTIVEKAQELHPDLIGLSGLITPSLDEMVHVVGQLRDAGVQVPVMIGGATTSALHTALKIAPVYQGPVIWVKDASQNPLVAARFLASETRAEAQDELFRQQEELRTRHQAAAQAPDATLDEARAGGLRLFD